MNGRDGEGRDGADCVQGLTPVCPTRYKLLWLLVRVVVVSRFWYMYKERLLTDRWCHVMTVGKSFLLDSQCRVVRYPRYLA